MLINEVLNKTTEVLKKVSDTDSSIWRTTEWNICHHIASRLKENFPNYDVDIELIKNNRRRPDIVIHKRGNNKDNLVVFQVKKAPKIQDIKNDIKKINETFFKKPYLYKFGFLISVGEIPIQISELFKKLPKFNLDRMRIITISGYEIICEDYNPKKNKNYGVNNRRRIRRNTS